MLENDSAVMLGVTPLSLGDDESRPGGAIISDACHLCEAVKRGVSMTYERLVALFYGVEDGGNFMFSKERVNFSPLLRRPLILGCGALLKAA